MCCQGVFNCCFEPLRLVSGGWVEGAALLASRRSASGESAQNLVDSRPADHRLRRGRVTFVVAGQPAVSGEQPQRPFGELALPVQGTRWYRGRSRRADRSGHPMRATHSRRAGPAPAINRSAAAVVVRPGAADPAAVVTLAPLLLPAATTPAHAAGLGVPQCRGLHLRNDQADQSVGQRTQLRHASPSFPPPTAGSGRAAPTLARRRTWSIHGAM